MSTLASAQDAPIAAKQPSSAREPVRLRLRKASSGAWLIEDESARCGGIFATQAAALKFIRLEFGPEAQVTTVSRAQKEAA